MVSAQGSAFRGSGRWVTSYGENIPQKGAWIGSFKPKRQNLYIAISPELLIRWSSDLKTEFRPCKALHGWSAITPKQIQRGWRPPSWKLIRRHISAADVPIWTKFGSRMQNDTLITVKWSRSKPEVEFQYGGRLYFETGSSYISAANWDNLTKFGLLIDFDLLKAATSANRKPEVVLFSSHTQSTYHNWIRSDYYTLSQLLSIYKTTAQLSDLTYAYLNHWVSTTQTTHSTGINYPVRATLYLY